MSQDAPPPLSFKLIARLLGYMGRYAGRRNALIVLVALRSVQLPTLAWMLGGVIGGPAARGDWPGIAAGAAGFVAFAFFTECCFVLRMRFAMQLGEAVMRDLRREVFAALLRQPMVFFKNTRLGTILSRVTSDIEAVRAGVQDVLFVSVVQIGQMLCCAALMAYYDWVLFLVVALMAPGVWKLGSYFRRKMSVATREVQESFSRVTSNLAESVGGIRVTQGFVRQEVNAGIFRKLVHEHSEKNVGIARTSAVFIPLLEVNTQFFIGALLLVGGYRALDPSIAADPGNLIRFFFLANLFFSPIQTLGNQFNAALAAMAGAERVFRLLDRAPEWADAADALDVPRLAGEVEMRGVCFGYEAGRRALHDVSFRAAPGETVAFVGHTGSGKSSLMNLLAKFYLPEQGEALFDGREVRAISGASLRASMGIVLQENFLFTGTIRENIRLGRPCASDAEVEETARQLDCLDSIKSLPGGFECLVGERGTGISLGQRQLICFCRALLAAPSILLLDEATSAVDAITEARLQAALERLRRGRTTFIVAHRLSTIKKASQVLVLDRGRVVERGTHEELVAAGGLYAGLAAELATGRPHARMEPEP